MDVSNETLWSPFELLLLECHDVSSTTITFLTEKGFTSLQQLKAETMTSMNTLFTDTPLPGLQIYYILKFLTEFKGPCLYSAAAYNIAMTTPHVSAIQHNRKRLKTIMKVDPVIVRLQAYHMFSEEDVANFCPRESNSYKVTKLVEIIPQKPDICFFISFAIPQRHWSRSCLGYDREKFVWSINTRYVCI